jgi:hypothetical protein
MRITDIAHFVLEEGFDVIQKPFILISPREKHVKFSMTGA